MKDTFVIAAIGLAISGLFLIAMLNPLAGGLAILPLLIACKK